MSASTASRDHNDLPFIVAARAGVSAYLMWQPVLIGFVPTIMIAFAAVAFAPTFRQPADIHDARAVRGVAYAPCPSS